MPADLPSDAPLKRVRIAPWRGPLHFGILISAATAAVSLLLAYVTMVALLFVWICMQLFHLTKSMATLGLLQWNLVAEFMSLLALGVTWVFMLRPLRPRPVSGKVALQITPGTQPQLFELIHELCWHLRIQPPSQVWLDSTITTRTIMKGGLQGILSGETMMYFGMPVISVITARELGGLLARELGHGAGGVGTLFVHTIREMNIWFYRAVMERDAWELNLHHAPKREQRWHRVGRALVRGWMWLAKGPFVLVAVAARASSSLALWVMDKAADDCGANVIGRVPLRRMQRKLALLRDAWDAAGQEIRRGIHQHRLPENLSLLMARHVAKAAQAKAAKGKKNALVDEPAADAQPPRAAQVVEHLSPSQPAASVLRTFVDLSRQVTYFYYQHDLGLNLIEHRMVAEEEVIHQNRREDESLLIIRRYFGGLAHPERAMCGLGATPTSSPGKAELQKTILRVREEIVHWGPQFKVALGEWNIAWQRRRDLEAAATLSMAGFAVSRLQFGTEDATAPVLRAEGARQRMVMEHMEGPLQERERELEARFSAALGLLWWSEPSELDEWLLNRRHELPAWVGIYEAMAGALPSFRELLTTFFAFQTLGAKFANVDDPGSFLTALQSVVPKMLNLITQIIGTMDGAAYPFTEDGRAIPLNDHLLQKPLPQPPAVSVENTDAASMRGLAVKMASDTSECIAPYVDAFMSLYHRAFAWLALTAERTETHFLGAMSLGSATEILLPDEFTSQRLSLRKKEQQELPGWKPQPVGGF
ncbi:MAG: hypothetical protein HS117_10435 [Verrucomicrobiaceae bacterium]|nr:hypothetical protein [Verrucomicrobiaceae bacterium]